MSQEVYKREIYGLLVELVRMVKKRSIELKMNSLIFKVCFIVNHEGLIPKQVEILNEFR